MHSQNQNDLGLEAVPILYHHLCIAEDRDNCLKPWSYHKKFDCQQTQCCLDSRQKGGSKPEAPCMDRNLLKIQLGFLRTCRQIYDEAMKTPYTTNTLAFDNGQNLLHFLKCEPHVSSIRSIRLFDSVWEGNDLFRWTGPLALMPIKIPGLQRIHVSIQQMASAAIWPTACAGLPNKKPSDTYESFTKDLLGLATLPLKVVEVAFHSDAIIYNHPITDDFEGYSSCIDCSFPLLWICAD